MPRVSALPFSLTLTLSLFVSLGLPASSRATEPFEINDGDRVLLLGDTLLERENSYGYLELRMHEQFPDRKFSVRNLSWAGETPKGISRASFDPPEKGFERLKEQIALVKPTVVFLGFGMAASLQEMTDRSQDWTLNPDPARYGAEPMSAKRFKGELGELMDAIEQIGTTESTERTEKGGGAKGSSSSVSSVNSVVKKSGVRFVLLSPIRHEDLRKTRPGSPDPAAHNKLLEQYSKAIEEIAKERGGRFVAVQARGTTDGIHLTETGFAQLSQNLDGVLGWKPGSAQTGQTLRPAILRKNALWFHRTRPANETYLFGFRKHEQGQNAKEIPEFDPLIEKADSEIDRLKRSKSATAAAKPTPLPQPETRDTHPEPLPTFDLGENLEISLWAANPLLVKPTQMNWDALGRLWVCGTAHYPQIAPGEIEKDQIFIIEDTDHDGKADKSTAFAGGMLMPTAIVPDLVFGTTESTEGTEKRSGRAASSSSVSSVNSVVKSACYVGASTEILRFEDTDGDGTADKKEIIFSGFGTEDTHHNVHTLKWGPDGRLYFNQSVYTHTHLETPYGMVRLNAGGVFAYDPRTGRVEVFSKGLWNPWGHAIDRFGQHFLTDGAGRDGIAWAFPGSVFAPSEGARQTMPLISPGTYPKFAGLEQIHSPHFPDDWQDTVVTCDFRAHRIVRFKINDLGSAKSGYVTQELPDLARTADLTFRPIDVKLGPDGALYIADWTNPVINHGEVDFRDPRRDKTHGRIWRITYKGRPTVKWEPLAGTPAEELMTKVLSPSQWEQEQARRTVAAKLMGASDEFEKIVPGWAGWTQFRGVVPAESRQNVEGMWLAGAIGIRNRSIGVAMQLMTNAATPAVGAYAPEIQALAARTLGRRPGDGPTPSQIETASIAESPRVRVEGMRALARTATIRSADLILTAAINAPADDPYYAFAAWRSINDLAPVWVDAVLKGEWKPQGKEKQLEFALKSIEPALAGKVLAQLVANGQAPLDGSGPWFELIGLAGGPSELRALLDAVVSGKVATPAQARALTAIVDAARTRNVRPSGDVASAGHWIALKAGALIPEGASVPEAVEDSVRAAALRLCGLFKLNDAMPGIAAAAREGKTPQPIRNAAFDALKAYGSASALRFLDEMTRPEFPMGLRRHALITIAQTKFNAGFLKSGEILREIKNPDEALQTWRALLAIQGAPVAFAHRLPKDLPQPILAAGLRAAREIGKKGQELVNVLTPLAGVAAGPAAPADYSDLVTQTLSSGDPAAGEEVYRRTSLACMVCHAIGGAGGKVGPELGTIGASAPLDYIIESLLNPNAKVKEGYNAVSLTQKDGAVAMGVPVRESSNDIVIRNAAGQEQTIAKGLIASRDNLGSIMPPGLTEQLKPREKLNLYAFLSQLGKKGVYDASRGHIARAWWTLGKDEGGKLKDEKQGLIPVGTPVVYANVDGRLPKERLAESLALLGNPGEVFVAAKLTAAEPTKTQLVLAGVREAWLDGKPLAVASEPSPAVELSAGNHTLLVKVDAKSLPDVLRAEAANVRFLTE